MIEQKTLKTTNLRKITRDLIGSTSEAYFPSFCVNCKQLVGRKKGFLCQECRDQIITIKTQTCFDCGRITKYGSFCRECRVKHHLKGLLYCSHYEGPVKELIHWYKYEKMVRISKELMTIIRSSLENYDFSRFDLVVPVPLHWERKLQRGYNQSEILAQLISGWAKLPVINVLKRVRNTDPQMKLKRKFRLKNIANAFICTKKDEILDRRILLIDDVTTTGATLEECARVLREAGAREVWGLVVAHGK